MGHLLTCQEGGVSHMSAEHMRRGTPGFTLLLCDAVTKTRDFESGCLIKPQTIKCAGKEQAFLSLRRRRTKLLRLVPLNGAVGSDGSRGGLQEVEGRRRRKVLMVPVAPGKMHQRSVCRRVQLGD